MEYGELVEEFIDELELSFASGVASLFKDHFEDPKGGILKVQMKSKGYHFIRYIILSIYCLI